MVNINTYHIWCEVSVYGARRLNVQWKSSKCVKTMTTCGTGLTDWHKGLWGRAVAGHADAVDGVHSHLVRDAFDHPLGFIGGFRERVKVQPHPPVALRLLPLQHVAWERKWNRHELVWNNENGGSSIVLASDGGGGGPRWRWQLMMDPCGGTGQWLWTILASDGGSWSWGQLTIDWLQQDSLIYSVPPLLKT